MKTSYVHVNVFQETDKSLTNLIVQNSNEINGV